MNLLNQSIKISLLLICVALFSSVSYSQETNKIKCFEFDEILLTHILTPTGPLPTVFDPNGIYPYVSFSETSNRPVPKTYRMISLENELVKVVISPDLGGKIISMIHKKSGKEVLYNPKLVRQTRILPRFYFIAGGIEVSFPISHTPTQNERILYKIDSKSDRTYVTCGERETHFGLQYSVEYSLGEDDDFLTQRVRMYNPGKNSYAWMSWSNAAIPSMPDTEYNFPNGEVLEHSSVLRTIDWKKDGLKTEKDIKEMTGYFWKTKDVNAFGAFTSSLGIGLYHVADEKSAPGIKLWSYGIKDDKEWAMLSTNKRQAYSEIQGGPISDQSIKFEIKPGENREHVEFWIPTDTRLDIYKLSAPHVSLRPSSEIPLFGWARENEINHWIQLLNAHERSTAIPIVDPLNTPWAPSGMENLDPAFKWAIENTEGFQKQYWKYYYATWLSGREKLEDALFVLDKVDFGLAKALKARLYENKNDFAKAELAYDSISEEWISNHPQVVVARDILLRKLGKSTIEKREKLLSVMDASPDEWIGERRVQLLIDKGLYKKAEDLLLSINFQKVHQTYTRTDMWNQINRALGRKAKSLPENLGEDRLARFGAYREFE